MKNFGAFGFDTSCYGIVLSNKIDIPSQNPNYEWLVEGEGKILEINHDTLTWNFSETLGNYNENFIAIAVR